MKPARRLAAGRPDARCLKWRGAASAEWLVVAPAVLAVGFGVLQWALLMHGRASVEYAAFQGVRAGATRHAEPDAIIEGVAIGLVGIRDAGLTGAPVSISAPAASAILREELASGVLAWRQRRPAPEDFDDWAQPALDEEGRVLDGVVEIPADNLRHRGTAVGPRSGRSLVEANVLEIELVYAWPMRVPLIGGLAVRWMEWFDRCAGAAPVTGSGPSWGRADWHIEGGAWRCPYYRAGGVPRWPLRVVASARMHSPARHAGTASVTAGLAVDPPAGGLPPVAGGQADTAGATVASGQSASPSMGDATPEEPAASSAGAAEPGPDQAESADAASVDAEPVDVSARADISQPGECFADPEPVTETTAPGQRG